MENSSPETRPSGRSSALVSHGIFNNVLGEPAPVLAPLWEAWSSTVMYHHPWLGLVAESRNAMTPMRRRDLVEAFGSVVKRCVWHNMSISDHAVITRPSPRSSPLFFFAVFRSTGIAICFRGSLVLLSHIGTRSYATCLLHSSLAHEAFSRPIFFTDRTFLCLLHAEEIAHTVIMETTQAFNIITPLAL